jgi:hypothetical protein
MRGKASPHNATAEMADADVINALLGRDILSGP